MIRMNRIATSLKRPQSPTLVHPYRLSCPDDQQKEYRQTKRQKLESTQMPPPELPHLASSLPSPSKAVLLTPAKSCQEKGNQFEYMHTPPSVSELISTLHMYNMPTKIYQAPHYSIESDAPERPREYAGLVYHLKGGTGIAILDEWENEPAMPRLPWQSGKLSNRCIHGWEYAGVPPSVRQVKVWLKENRAWNAVNKRKGASQVRLRYSAQCTKISQVRRSWVRHNQILMV